MFNEGHFRQIPEAYLEYYHNVRPHQSPAHAEPPDGGKITESLSAPNAYLSLSLSHSYSDEVNRTRFGSCQERAYQGQSGRLLERVRQEALRLFLIASRTAAKISGSEKGFWMNATAPISSVLNKYPLIRTIGIFDVTASCRSAAMTLLPLICGSIASHKITAGRVARAVASPVTGSDAINTS